MGQTILIVVFCTGMYLMAGAATWYILLWPDYRVTKPFAKPMTVRLGVILAWPIVLVIMLLMYGFFIVKQAVDEWR